MTNEESADICQKAAVALGEHYDAVQILATWNEESVTKRTYSGTGNDFARIGMAGDFITQCEQSELAEKLADAIVDSEEWGDD